MHNAVTQTEYISLSEEDFISVYEVGLNISDFAVVNSSSHGFLLFCHGTEDGYIILGDEEYTLEELSKIIDISVSIKVVCCYGSHVQSYEDEYTKIEPLIYCDGKIYVDTNYYAATGCLIIYPQ